MWRGQVFEGCRQLMQPITRCHCSQKSWSRRSIRLLALLLELVICSLFIRKRLQSRGFLRYLRDIIGSSDCCYSCRIILQFFNANAAFLNTQYFCPRWRPVCQEGGWWASLIPQLTLGCRVQASSCRLSLHEVTIVRIKVGFDFWVVYKIKVKLRKIDLPPAQPCSQVWELKDLFGVIIWRVDYELFPF